VSQLLDKLAELLKRHPERIPAFWDYLDEQEKLEHEDQPDAG
jgi:hypothetical protein